LKKERKFFDADLSVHFL